MCWKNLSVSKDVQQNLQKSNNILHAKMIIVVVSTMTKWKKAKRRTKLQDYLKGAFVYPSEICDKDPLQLWAL